MFRVAARRVSFLSSRKIAPRCCCLAKRSSVNFARGSSGLHIVGRDSRVIQDLQRATLQRNEEFVKLQIRKLTFITRFGLWNRKNFTVLSHLAFLGVGAWIMLDSTQFLSVTLLGLNALNLHGWLTSVVASAVGYMLTADVTIGKVIPKWTKGTIRVMDMKILRDPEEAVRINGAAMDMDIKEIDVKLSLSHAIAGQGILSDISLTGMTGILDRRTTIWTEEMELASTKREASDNDFHFDSVKIKDLSLTIYQNCPNRPLELTIFSLKLPRLRQHWLLLDLFDADAGHGKFDNCLFSVENINTNYETQVRRNHFKIDGLDFDLVSSSYPKGVLSWITQGFMDIDCFYDVPLHYLDERSLKYNSNMSAKEYYKSKFDMDLSLNNINISLPNITSNDISVTNYAMVQPIVSYFNTNYVKIPLQLKFQLPMDDFSGAWYPGEANLYDAISNSSYEDLLRLIEEQKQYRRARELLMMGINGCYRGTKYYITQTWYYIKEHV